MAGEFHNLGDSMKSKYAGKKGKMSARAQAEAFESGDSGAPNPEASAKNAKGRTFKTNRIGKMKAKC